MGNASKNEKLGDSDRVLLRLAEPQAYGCITPEGGLELFVSRNQFACPVLRITAGVLDRLMREELVYADGERRVITPLGRIRLARLAAADSPHRSQHQILATEEIRGINGKAAQVRVNRAESPLGWLASHTDREGKALISQEQFTAGEKLRKDFTLASLSPRVTAEWGMPVSRAGRGGGGGAAEMNDVMMEARDRVWRALDAVGPDLAAVLLLVCCHLKGLGEAEKELRWPTRAGKVVLGIALDRLAAHYGLRTGEKPAHRARRVEFSEQE